MEMVEKYGADALRLYLLSSPVMQAENLSFSESGVDEVAKKNLGRLGNVLAFYKLYENPTAPHLKNAKKLRRRLIFFLATSSTPLSEKLKFSACMTGDESR